MTEAEEPVVVPDEEEREEAPPSWLKEGTEAAAPPEPENKGNDESADILVELVSSVHSKLAEATRYDGWLLSENDIRLWTKVLRFLLRKLPSKDWPLAIAVVSLAISESMKFVGYMRFRRENTVAAPVRAPPPPVEPEPVFREAPRAQTNANGLVVPMRRGP